MGEKKINPILSKKKFITKDGIRKENQNKKSQKRD
jgi:hypothetical protein